jgi:urea transport system permease protein
MNRTLCQLFILIFLFFATTQKLFTAIQIQKIASDEDDVIVKVLDEISKTGDEKYLKLLDAFREGSLFFYEEKIYYNLGTIENDDLDEFVQVADVFTREPLVLKEFPVGKNKASLVIIDDITLIEPGRKIRKEISKSKMVLNLYSKDYDKQLAAIKKTAFMDDSIELLSTLQGIIDQGGEEKILYTAEESSAIIALREGDDLQKDEAIITLGKIQSLRGYDLLKQHLASGESEEKRAFELKTAIHSIETHQLMVEIFNLIKTGLSAGSILILMGLGLAITFGMMGIINMAHGEMMMIGAYTTYCVQLVFGHSSTDPNDIYFMFALPAAFLVSMLMGALIEVSVVRKLYSRPLESLLATYGIGLILIQITRLIFGDNCPSNSPTYLQGGVEVFKDMTLQYNRIFIFMLTLLCLFGVIYIFKSTSLGLKMKASMQNRNMASAMGINTRKVDLLTFMIGSGLAGVAGNALITIGGITPDMGSNYIVDSFLVVVTGGVGNVYGVVCSGMGLGVINKTLEATIFGTVWAKIIVLLFVIVFIQFRPSGLFALKGRHADD